MTANDTQLLSFAEFCESLKEEGAYIGDDHHLHAANGKLLSRECPNGYFMVRKMYDSHVYNFMEHRVIWYFVNGAFDETLVINHRNFDRADNRIENLELMTQRENIEYSMTHERYPDCSGPNHHRAVLTEKDVQLIRYLCKAGYKRKDVAAMFDVKNANLISRVVTGARYGNVVDAASVTSIYPLLVERTARMDLEAKDRMMNAVLGLCGESGEVADAVKKAAYQGHELDVNHVAEELGDVLFYLCWLCIEFGIDFSDICYQNMKKLIARYPDGFDSERSIHRPEYEQEVINGVG